MILNALLRLLFAAMIAFAFVQSSVVSAQDSSPSELALELRQTIEAIQSVRQQRRLAVEQHETQRDLLTRQIDRLKSELTPMQATVAQANDEITSLKRNIEQQESKRDQANAWIDRIVKLAIALTDRTFPRVANTVGLRESPRLARLQAASRQLSDESVEQRIDGVFEALSFFTDEWLPARSVTLSNRELIFDEGKRSTHAWTVGLGLATSVFLSEDEQTAGIASGNPESPWKLDLTTETQDEIKRLLEIIREQAPPNVTTLPVIVGSQKDGEN